MKLLAAVGAWGACLPAGGPWSAAPFFALQVALVSILAGGLLALASLAARRRLVDFGGRAYRWFRSALVPGLVLETGALDGRHQLPFGVAIAAATLLIVWGGSPW